MAETPRMPDVHSIACRVRLLSRQIHAFTAAVLEPMGVTPSQAECLYHLLHGETGPSVIAAKIGLDASNLSRMIRQFEERDWVSRTEDPSNRTRVTLKLTAKGRQAARRIDPHAAVVQRALADGLTAAERKTLDRILSKMSEAMEREPSA